MLKWLSSKVLSRSAAVEAKGTLIEYAVGKKPITSVIDAIAIIDKSKSESEFDHYLIVNEEGDPETHYSWILDESRQFSAVANDQGVKAIAWRDDEDFNTWFIFVFDKESESDGQVLQTLACTCIYENMQEESAAKEDVSQIEDDVCGEIQFGFDLITLAPLSTKRKASSRPQSGTASRDKEAATIPKRMAPKLFEHEEVEECSRALVNLFRLSSGTNIFGLVAADVDLSLIRVGSPKEFRYYINVEQGDQCIFQQTVSSMRNVLFFQQHNSIVWNLYLEGLSTWSVVFQNAKEERSFKEDLTMAIYEMVNKQPWDKLKQEDRVMLRMSHQADGSVEETDDDDDDDDDYMDFDDDVDMASPDGDDYDEYDDEDEDEYDDDDEDQYAPRRSKGRSSSALKDKNRFLVDSGRHERTFVVRGNQIGVFKRDDKDVYFDTSMAPLHNSKGADLKPATMMLHQGDRHLLLVHDNQQDKSHRGRVYQLDIEKEKVVQEWNALDDLVPVTNTAPVYKYADTPLFGVLNTNAVFGMDPRISGKNKVIGDINKYFHSSKPDFSCMATSKEGYVALGSHKGEIRLLSGVPGVDKITGRGANPKTAKTLLPGFGDPIIGIDVTADGKFVLATCKDYLLLIDTEMPDMPGKTGFTERMGAKKPSPIRLQLLPEDVELLGEKGVDFSPAQFNTGSDGEMWIVTSSGPYIFTWDFHKIRKGGKAFSSSYVKKKVEHLVMDESFLNVGESAPGRNAPIVVVMPDDVKLEKLRRVRKNPHRRMPNRYK